MGDSREKQEKRWDMEATGSPGALLAGLFLDISADPFLLQIRQDISHFPVPSLARKG